MTSNRSIAPKVYDLGLPKGHKLVTPLQYSEEWYQPDEVHSEILITEKRGPVSRRIPKDTLSKEFAEWLTAQYRLTMSIGIAIGQAPESPDLITSNSHIIPWPRRAGVRYKGAN